MNTRKFVESLTGAPSSTASADFAALLRGERAVTVADTAFAALDARCRRLAEQLDALPRAAQLAIVEAAKPRRRRRAKRRSVRESVQAGRPPGRMVRLSESCTIQDGLCSCRHCVGR